MPEEKDIKNVADKLEKWALAQPEPVSAYRLAAAAALIATDEANARMWNRYD
ncbi:hypothetical protein [Specibacter sp. NPDC078692]|uniref:hypothetical protein n=1 Tax=Specibacter sp. NPDC078692 TaxID=3155818 RepID=UPI00341B2772